MMYKDRSLARKVLDKVAPSIEREKKYDEEIRNSLAKKMLKVDKLPKGDPFKAKPKTKSRLQGK